MYLLLVLFDSFILDYRPWLISFSRLSSQQLGVSDASGTSWAEMAIDDCTLSSWDERLERLSTPNVWFDDASIKHTACFLSRDIICSTMSGVTKFCPMNENNSPTDFLCICNHIIIP